MSMPFDASMKHLVENYTRDWMDCAGLKDEGDIVQVDSDLSTVTAPSDRLFIVGGRKIIHFEPESSWKPHPGRRYLLYNAIAHDKYGLPVATTALLLRKEADSPEMTGEYGYEAGEGASTHFRYRVFKLWEEPPETFLNGGLGVVPASLLSNASEEQYPEIIHRMGERINNEAADRDEANRLWASSYVLAGLRLSVETAQRLFGGVQSMKESTTYQAILAEGIAEGKAKGIAEGKAEGEAIGEAKLLLKFGSVFLGEPSPEVREQIGSIQSVERLDKMSDRLAQGVSSWEELIGEGKEV